MAKKAKSRGGMREGAGRPVGPDGPTVLVTATVPESLVNDLKQLAADQGWSVSRTITEAIRRFVKAKKR